MGSKRQALRERRSVPGVEGALTEEDPVEGEPRSLPTPPRERPRPEEPARLTPEERTARREARAERAKHTYRPPLDLSASFEESYGRSAMNEGGRSPHTIFVEAAIKAGMLTPKPKT